MCGGHYVLKGKENLRTDSKAGGRRQAGGGREKSMMLPAIFGPVHAVCRVLNMFELVQ